MRGRGKGGRKGYRECYCSFPRVVKPALIWTLVSRPMTRHYNNNNSICIAA